MEVSKKIDEYYKKMQDYLTKKIGTFVAFLFVLYSLGALTTIIIMSKYPQHALLVALVPALAGIIAYYNRVFATIVFFLLIFLMLLF